MLLYSSSTGTASVRLSTGSGTFGATAYNSAWPLGRVLTLGTFDAV